MQILSKGKKHLAAAMALLLLLALLSGCNKTVNTPAVSGATGSDASVTGGSTDVGYDNYDDTAMNTNWQQESSITIEFKQDTVSVSKTNSAVTVLGSAITIHEPGTYLLQGSLSNGSVTVDAGDSGNVWLVLNGVTIHNESGAAIVVKQSKNTIVTLADGTENTLSDGTVYTLAAGEEEPDACLFSQDDLILNGSGKLTVTANYDSAIKCKDDLVITGGVYAINSVDDGIVSRDTLAILAGSFTIDAGGDSLKSSNDSDTAKGNIYLDGGDYMLTSGGDGVQSANGLAISTGTFQIVSGGGSVNSSDQQSINSDMPNQWWGTPAATVVSADSASAKGLKAAKLIQISGGTFQLDTADDTIHCDTAIVIEDGSFTLSSGDDGVHADSELTINGGSLQLLQSYEGLESSKITINGGEVLVNAKDDGINIAGGNDASSLGNRPGQNTFAADSNQMLVINGGQVVVYAAGDGLDSNGSIEMNGGTVIVHGPTDNGNGAVDYNGSFQLNGGILLAAGSSGMAQNVSDTSTQPALAAAFSTKAANTAVQLTDANGKVLISFVPSKAFQWVLISTPELAQGQTYSLYSDGSVSGSDLGGSYAAGDISKAALIETVKLSQIATTIGTVGGAMGGAPMGGKMR